MSIDVLLGKGLFDRFYKAANENKAFFWPEIRSVIHAEGAGRQEL
jgi:hypothetical protein